MSFNSIQFLVFLFIVFFLYWGCNAKHRWIVLFVANIVFYSFAGISYTAILVYVCLVTYLFIGFSRTHKSRWILAIGIILELLPLIFFKYTAFFQNNVNAILKAIGSNSYIEPLQIMLPLGISFYTFSATAYLIDSYSGKNNDNYRFCEVMTGIAFFPCLIAGPIERQNQLLPQIFDDKKFDYDLATYGLKRIAFGAFKKYVIADTLVITVNNVFSDAHQYHGLSLLLAMVFFSIEIYCDFSGYSDMAIGIARLFGITLRENFLGPFFSTSYAELWRKWHISLSSWFRDYVYIPLGGGRKGKLRKAINTIIVFSISGLWHGAAMTFVIWGLLNGVIQIIESIVPPLKLSDNNTFLKVLKGAFVFIVFSITAVFFRADTVTDACYIIIHIFSDIVQVSTYSTGILYALGMTGKKLIIVAFELMLLVWYDYTAIKKDPVLLISEKPLVLRWAIYIFFVLLIAQLSVKSSGAEFIYAAF